MLVLLLSTCVPCCCTFVMPITGSRGRPCGVHGCSRNQSMATRGGRRKPRGRRRGAARGSRSWRLQAAGSTGQSEEQEAGSVQGRRRGGRTAGRSEVMGPTRGGGSTADLLRNSMPAKRDLVAKATKKDTANTSSWEVAVEDLPQVYAGGGGYHRRLLTE